ncbi:MAG: hypothetical protein RBR56_00540 [Halothiobacillus sp.]|jgi:hypothetical protein|nr:hypothetical protein [Halothiobacillus sp.]
MKTVFVLGAMDPEMREIEKVINTFLDEKIEIGQTGGVLYAAKDGVQVTPSTAYKADGFVTSEGIKAEMPSDVGWLITVECAVDGLSPHDKIDHHNPGDHGYGFGPEKYWEGSSLGQLCRLLEVEPTTEQRIAAAADHCLSHAYQGKCPGIDPKALRDWRVKSRSSYQGVEAKVIEQSITEAINTLEGLPKITVGTREVANSVAIGSFPEAPEAVAITGIPLMYSMPDKATGRTKVGLLGADAETIRAWMEEIGTQMLVEDIYGSPERGYAGAYIK